MTMLSKYRSSCKACGCTINVGDEIEWTKGVGARHARVEQCMVAKQLRAKLAQAPAPQVNLKPIVDFLKAAQDRGLKAPKLRVLAPDGRSELRLSLTRQGQAPGSLAVVLGMDYVGGVRPSGEMVGNLARDEELQKHLLNVANDPAKAAKEFAALMGRCSFCDSPLTDEGSVEVGYGPICARHWGLPHKAKGSPTLHPLPKE